MRMGDSDSPTRTESRICVKFPTRLRPPSRLPLFSFLSPFPQIYYLASAVIAATFLHEQRGFLTGEQQKPTGESFLEREAISSSKFSPEAK